MKTYKELLGILDCIFADYGNQSMEIPEDIKDPEGDFDILTEEECKTIFEYNNGCVESCLEFDGEEEY